MSCFCYVKQNSWIVLIYFGRIAFLVGSYCTVKENFLNVASVNPEFGKTLASESCFCRQLCYSWTYSNYNNCSWVKLSSACQKHNVWTGLSIFFFSGGQDSIRDYVTVFYRLLCHSSATATFMRSRLLSTSFSASSALNWIPNPAAWLICSTFSPNNISGREGSSSSEEILWEKGIV